MNFVIDTGQPATPVAPPATGEGFSRFGIDHLSASSINLWTNAPDVWVAKYILGKSTAFGPAPKRGIVVEDAVASMLTGESRDDALKASFEKFDAAFPHGEDAAKQRDMIEPMTDLAFAELEGFGVPEFQDGKQEKISIDANFDGWSIPVWGFLDFVFPAHGLVVDLKTTGRMPSTMSGEHQLQRAIYARAKGNMAVKFLYITPKKAAMLEDGDPSECLARAKVHIARMDNFLRQCPDAATAASIIPVNPASFYWRGSELMLHEIYGL